MARPTADIVEVRAAHARLHRTVTRFDDATVRRPSRLPGWSVGHVLTHLARNADSVVRRLQGAERRERVEQYPGGAIGRAAEIQAGATRPAGIVSHDVVASDLVFARWREVEIHHVDLDRAYTMTDWPDSFVERMMSRVLRSLPGRSDARALLGRTLGRAAAPILDPWGDRLAM